MSEDMQSALGFNYITSDEDFVWSTRSQVDETTKNH